MLDIRNVQKTFDPDVVALQAVNLAIEPGEIVSLVGTSGCGKSTLLRIVSGLDRATRGLVSLSGEAISGPRSEIGMVFQEPRLMPWLTVAENVRFALSSLPKNQQDERIAEVLERVGLTRFARAYPRQLSGGMAQRVAIARALVRRPELLLLDEPFSALDSFTKLSLQEHLLDLWRRARFTMLFVTHDIEEAAALSDRIVVMRGHPGRIHSVAEVDLPRPRDRATREFQALKQDIIRQLDLS